MAKLSSITTGPKILIVGHSGSAKTGSLASLVDAGYKLRILDYDHKVRPLQQFSDPKNHGNVDVIQLKDKMRYSPEFGKPIPSGAPTAYVKGLRMIDHWKYIDEDDKEVDLGCARDWGTDTVLVVDSLTAMGDACMLHRLHLQNRSGRARRKQDWGEAQSMQLAFIEKCNVELKCNVIIMAHLKIVGPEIPEPDIKDDNLRVEIKEVKAKVASLVPFRYFPSALGKALPQDIATHFDVTLLAEIKVSGRRVDYLLHTQPRPELDLKVPIKNLEPTYDIRKDGLLTLLRQLGG